MSCVLIVVETVGAILNTVKPGNHCTALVLVGYSPFQQINKERSVHKHCVDIILMYAKLVIK
jgi:hypothetical protein